MELTDMKRSPAEAKAMTEPAAVEPNPYPYGLCLRLDKEELEKLGIDKLSAAGDEYHIMAIASVRSVRQEQGENDQDSKSIELQITHMVAMHEDEAEKEEGGAAETLYPGQEQA